MASTLYTPDLATFRETDAERGLTYRNTLGGVYRVRVVLIKSGGIETYKHRGDDVIVRLHRRQHKQNQQED